MYMYMYVCITIFNYCNTVRQVWEWIKEYSGTIVFNPANELKEIPNHSSFFALAPDNRYSRNYSITVKSG